MMMEMNFSFLCILEQSEKDSIGIGFCGMLQLFSRRDLDGIKWDLLVKKGNLPSENDPHMMNPEPDRNHNIFLLLIIIIFR